MTSLNCELLNILTLLRSPSPWLMGILLNRFEDSEALRCYLVPRTQHRADGSGDFAAVTAIRRRQGASGVAIAALSRAGISGACPAAVRRCALPGGASEALSPCSSRRGRMGSL